MEFLKQKIEQEFGEEACWRWTGVLVGWFGTLYLVGRGPLIGRSFGRSLYQSVVGRLVRWSVVSRSFAASVGGRLVGCRSDSWLVGQTIGGRSVGRWSVRRLVSCSDDALLHVRFHRYVPSDRLLFARFPVSFKLLQACKRRNSVHHHQANHHSRLIAGFVEKKDRLCNCTRWVIAETPDQACLRPYPPLPLG